MPKPALKVRFFVHFFTFFFQFRELVWKKNERLQNTGPFDPKKSQTKREFALFFITPFFHRLSPYVEPARPASHASRDHMSSEVIRILIKLQNNRCSWQKHARVIITRGLEEERTIWILFITIALQHVEGDGIQFNSKIFIYPFKH